MDDSIFFIITKASIQKQINTTLTLTGVTKFWRQINHFITSGFPFAGNFVERIYIYMYFEYLESF